MTGLAETLARAVEMARSQRGAPARGEPVARMDITAVPSFGWSFEDAELTFEVENLGHEVMADPAQHARCIAVVDLHDAQGRFLRRAAARSLPEPIAIGAKRSYTTPVPINLFGGRYELRAGLRLASLPAEAQGEPRLQSQPTRGRAAEIEIKNTIFEMFVEVVNACNFRCSFCPQGELVRPQKPMDFDLATKVVKDLADMGHHHPIRCHLLGEPLLYKRYFDFVDMAHDHGQTIHLATNGSRFTRENIEGIFRTNLDHLLISLNTPEEPLYNEQRGTQVPYSEYIQGITDMVSERVRRGAGPETVINVLYDGSKKDDPAEIERVRGIVGEWVDVAREAGDGRELPSPEEFVGFTGIRATQVELLDGLKVQFTSYHTWGQGKPPEDPFCSYPWRQLGVFVDGQATACCVDAQGEINLGNARFQSIEEIWNGPQLERMRQGFLAGQTVESLCQRCDVRHGRNEFVPAPQA